MLTLLWIALGKHVSFQGNAPTECIKHLPGGQREFQGGNNIVLFWLIRMDNDKNIQSTPGEKFQYANQKEKLLTIC